MRDPATANPDFPTRRTFLAGTLASAACAASPSSLQSLASPPEPAHGTPALARKLAADPRRPQFHLLPAANWMNDPNGPIFWHGKYHMFHQYNPHAAVWGDMHWYHSVSRDMVTWTHLPVALAPTPGGPDADGCFTGSAIAVGSRVYQIYTGVVKSTPALATLRDGNSNLLETQCLAWSDDPDLLHWQKLAEPILAATPPGVRVTGFRDPSVWKDGDTFYMTVGSGVEHIGGNVLLYSSPDLRRWTYLHPIAGGAWLGKPGPNPVDTGEMWECPDLFPLDGKHVLIFSTEGVVFWQSGALHPTTKVFTKHKEGLLDHGSFYAPKTQLDAQGRRILWGWIPETRPEKDYAAAGWAGMMSLPRVLSLDPAGNLTMEVLPEAASLRHELQVPPAGRPLTVPAATGELLYTFSRRAPFSLSLKPESGPAILALRYDPAASVLHADSKTIPIPPSGNHPIELHAFIDGSVLELLVDRHASYTKRFYYPGPQAPDLAIQIGAESSPLSAALWPIVPISYDRLTDSEA